MWVQRVPHEALHTSRPSEDGLTMIQLVRWCAHTRGSQISLHYLPYWPKHICVVSEGVVIINIYYTANTHANIN